MFHTEGYVLFQNYMKVLLLFMISLSLFKIIETMEAILIKNEIYAKVEKLTAEQLLLVSDFVGLVEKALPTKRTSVAKKEKINAVNGQRNMTAIHELQKMFQETGLSQTIVADVILEREDRL